jgi:hypothetical protein
MICPSGHTSLFFFLSHTKPASPHLLHVTFNRHFSFQSITSTAYFSYKTMYLRYPPHLTADSFRYNQVFATAAVILTFASTSAFGAPVETPEPAASENRGSDADVALAFDISPPNFVHIPEGFPPPSSHGTELPFADQREDVGGFFKGFGDAISGESRKRVHNLQKDLQAALHQNQVLTAQNQQWARQYDTLAQNVQRAANEQAKKIQSMANKHQNELVFHFSFFF